MEPKTITIFLIYAALAPEYSGLVDRDRRVGESSSNQGGMPVVGAHVR
jgi:hypothetical protein